MRKTRIISQAQLGIVTESQILYFSYYPNARNKTWCTSNNMAFNSLTAI